MARTEFRFAHRMRVRWAEVDKQGIVFNGHYLMYFDVAITEYYRALGYPYPEGLAQHGTDPHDLPRGIRRSSVALLQSSQLSKNAGTPRWKNLQFTRRVQGVEPKLGPRACPYDVFELR